MAGEHFAADGPSRDKRHQIWVVDFFRGLLLRRKVVAKNYYESEWLSNQTVKFTEVGERGKSLRSFTWRF